jgi:hypothetical protein
MMTIHHDAYDTALLECWSTCAGLLCSASTMSTRLLPYLYGCGLLLPCRLTRRAATSTMAGSCGAASTTMTGEVLAPQAAHSNKILCTIGNSRCHPACASLGTVTSG